MKRIFSLILFFLLAVVFTTAHAQQNIFIWSGGKLYVESATDLDSITSSVGSWLFTIRTLPAGSVTNNTFGGSVRVSLADNVHSLWQDSEVGVCFSSEKSTPTYADEFCRLGNGIDKYDFTLYDLDPGTTYYYRAYVKLDDDVYYGNVRSVNTLGEKPVSSTYTLINGYQFVDLGLPSGLLWARSNVGAGSSTDYGDYYAWGEIEPKNKDMYSSWRAYKWGSSCSKYNSSDGKTILHSEDDVATVNWGTPCRMPSSTEFEELYNECDWTWMPNTKGTGGYLVTGPNGNTIFFPAAGAIGIGGLPGFYWSRSLYSLDTKSAYNLGFYSGNVSSTSRHNRFFGGTVRPVVEK